DAGYYAARLARCVILDDQLHVTGHGDLGALGPTHEARLQLVELDLEVARGLRQDLGVTAGGRDLERLGRLRALLDVDELARLHAERRAVDDLAVDEDVAVHDELTGLRRGTGEAGAEHERVEAHLEELDEVLTGQARLTTGLVEDDAQLLLTDAVLLAQTLLLAQTHRVVAVGLALGAAVLAGSVGTLLEVAGGLRSQRDAEGAGEADLATVLCLGGGHGCPSNTWPRLSRLTDVHPSIRNPGRTSTRPADLKVGCVRTRTSLAYQPSKRISSSRLTPPPPRWAAASRPPASASASPSRAPAGARAGARSRVRSRCRSARSSACRAARPAGTAARRRRTARRARSGSPCRARGASHRGSAHPAGASAHDRSDPPAHPRSPRRSPCRRRSTWGRSRGRRPPPRAGSAPRACR